MESGEITVPSVLVLVLVVVLAWAVVLLPVFRHRDDALREAKSFQMLAQASRVLQRRRPVTGDRRYRLMPRRLSVPVVGPRLAAAGEGMAAMRIDGPGAASEGRGTGSGSGPGVPVSVSRPGRPGRPGATPAQRRVRVLVGLAGLVVLQGLLAALVGPGFLVGLGLAVLLLAGYVVVLRRGAVARNVRRRAVASSRAAHPANGSSATYRGERVGTAVQQRPRAAGGQVRQMPGPRHGGDTGASATDERPELRRAAV